MGDSDCSSSTLHGQELGTVKSNCDFYIKPDYKQWLTLEYWDITESIFLLHNWHPRDDDYLRDEDGEVVSECKHKIWLQEEMKKTLFHLEISIRDGSVNSNNGKIRVKDLLNWANGKDFRLPNELYGELKKINRVKSNKRVHCKELNSFVGKTLEGLMCKNSIFPSAINILKELEKKYKNDLDLIVSPDRNSPKSIEYTNSKDRRKTITFKTFRNLISEMKRKTGY